MPVETFISNLRGVNNGNDLHQEFLIESYNNIYYEEIKTCRNVSSDYIYNK